jgi:hypothetical protein
MCASTHRELKSGEWFYSVLFEDKKGTIKRLDYSQDGWEGVPSNENVEIIGYWKSQMAGQNENKIKLAPNDILLNLFDQIGDQLDKQEMRYVLALLLIRRRILRLEKEENAENGHKNMILYCPKRETNYWVPIAHPGDKQIEEMQNTLISLLYAG